jgi:hypothetical protein
VAEALARAIAEGQLPQQALLDLVTAHEFDLFHDRMPDLTALEAYMGEAYSRLIMMAAMILDRDAAPKASECAGLAGVVEKAFKDHGRPVGYIKGEEAGGAITVGLRYGHGTLQLKAGSTRSVHWQGPSIGFDLGANASKVFVLVYNLHNVESLFQRFPAVDGSFYYVGGAGINYQRRDGITLAPIRLGVGLRAGASIGYVHYTKTKTLNPF